MTISSLSSLSTSSQYMRPAPPDPAEMMKKMDTDGDGKISKSEFTVGKPSEVSSADSENLFSKIDADQDGDITEEELKADQERMKERMDARKEMSFGASGTNLLSLLNSSSDDEDSSTSSVTSLLKSFFSKVESRWDEYTSSESTDTESSFETFLSQLEEDANSVFSSSDSDTSSGSQVQLLKNQTLQFISQLKDDYSFWSQQDELQQRYSNA